MSFDVFFTPPPIRGDVAGAMESHQLRSAQLPVRDELDEWMQIEAKINNEFSRMTSTGFVEGTGTLFDPRGIRISFYPGEISLSCPEGLERELSEPMQRLAVIVEKVTGLVAYDTQHDCPFRRSQMASSGHEQSALYS